MWRMAAAMAASAALGCGALLGVDDLHDRDASDANDASDAPVEAANDADDTCAQLDAGQCAPFEQCPCTATENCMVMLNGTTRCVDAGAIAEWNACGSTAACKKGMECIGSACKPFCRTAADCAGTNVTCEQIKNPPNTGSDIPGLKVCSAGCDPVNPSAICGPGVTCGPSPWDGNGLDHGDCFGNALGKTGPNACAGNAGACAPGWVCVNGNDCDPWCRVADDAGCPANSTCHSFMETSLKEEPVISGVEYGFCN